MPRQRMIKPEFWSSEDIGELSFGARLAYVASWNLADDEGKCRGALPWLQGQIFPYDNVCMSKLFEELCGAGHWVPYVVAGRSYIWIPKFLEHQRINRPYRSTLPDPPEEAIASLSASIKRDYAKWLERRSLMKYEEPKEDDEEGGAGTIRHSVNDSVNDSRSHSRSKSKSKSKSKSNAPPPPTGEEMQEDPEQVQEPTPEARARAGDWELVKERIRQAIDEESFATWIMPVECLGLGSDGIWLAVQSDFILNWIEHNYAEQISAAASQVMGLAEAPAIHVSVSASMLD